MNKICIILTNPKDIDYFINFIKIYHLKNVEIFYIMILKNWNNEVIEKFKLKNSNLRLKKLSTVYFCKKKYQILISTGDSPPINFLYLIFHKIEPK